MVFGGDVLLGTCVGFQGSVGGSGGRRGLSGVFLAARAGEEVSRAVARLEPPAAARSERLASLRRPALAVGHGLVGRGRPRGAFF